LLFFIFKHEGWGFTTFFANWSLWPMVKISWFNYPWTTYLAVHESWKSPYINSTVCK
jgi:hypothetical protein